MSNREENESPKRKVAEIVLVPYGECGISTDPSREEIRQAIEQEQLDSRNFQTDLEDLKKEWVEKLGHESINNQEQAMEWARIVREYHARRIAYFVVHGWTDPIKTDAASRITDGSHRIRAAFYKGMEEVEVISA